jgi:hypothetical protein
MKKISILLFVIMSCSQPRQGNQIVRDAGIYDCTLKEFQKQGVNCGIRAIAETMKFTLMGKDIAAVIQCPESFGEKFWQPGEQYILTLTSDSSSCIGFSVYNLYKDSLETYFAEDAIKK